MKKVLMILLLTLFLLPLCFGADAAAGGENTKASGMRTKDVENILTPEYIPDENFRKVLAEEANDKYERSTNTLSETEAATWKSLYVTGEGISDLTGIEYFTSLERFMCGYNSLTTLDVSKFSTLKELDCSGNKLTTLKLPANDSLESLACGGNSLTKLDLSKYTSLKKLMCENNKLKKLDISKNTALDSIGCGFNSLTKLDVSKNPDLKSILCENNNLTELDLRKNPKLEWLICNDNNLKTLLTDNPELLYLECNSVKLTTLDLSKFPKLKGLYCKSNSFTELDVSKNSKLVELRCDENRLGTLDLSKNTELTSLTCSSNKLTTLDVSQNLLLNTLNCNKNRLTTLDVTHNTELKTLKCESNNLSALNITKNTKLNELYCTDNALAMLDFAQNPLYELECNAQHVSLEVLNKDGIATADLSKLVGKENCDKISVEKGKYDNTTGVYTFEKVPALNDTFTYKYALGNKLPAMEVTVKVSKITTPGSDPNEDPTPAPTPIPGLTQEFEASEGEGEGERGTIKSLYFIWGEKKKAKSATVANNSEEDFSFDYKYNAKKGYSVSLALSSSDPDVADAYFSSGKELVLLARKPGKCVITCKDNISGKKCTLKVTVQSPKIAKIEIAEQEYHLKKGDTLDLSAQVAISPAEAGAEPLKYSSNTKKVASVSKNGMIKAKKAGTATITVSSKKDSSVSCTCTIVVEE